MHTYIRTGGCCWGSPSLRTLTSNIWGRGDPFGPDGFGALFLWIALCLAFNYGPLFGRRSWFFFATSMMSLTKGSLTDTLGPKKKASHWEKNSPPTYSPSLIPPRSHSIRCWRRLMNVCHSKKRAHLLLPHFQYRAERTAPRGKIVLLHCYPYPSSR